MEDAPEEAARGSDAIRLDSSLKAESAAIELSKEVFDPWALQEVEV